MLDEVNITRVFCFKQLESKYIQWLFVLKLLEKNKCIGLFYLKTTGESNRPPPLSA